MTLHISDDQAMDAVVASRPESDAIDNAWYVGAGLCMAGAIMSLAIRRQRILEGATEKVSA